jgi:hypothetical protein
LELPKQRIAIDRSVPAIRVVAPALGLAQGPVCHGRDDAAVRRLRKILSASAPLFVDRIGVPVLDRGRERTNDGEFWRSPEATGPDTAAGAQALVSIYPPTREPAMRRRYSSLIRASCSAKAAAPTSRCPTPRERVTQRF